METRTSLTGRTALVWGGGGAIGSAVAHALAGRGADVCVAGRTAATLARCADQAPEGTRITSVVADASDPHQVEEVTRALTVESGLHIVATMIGVTHTQGMPMTELTLGDYAEPIIGNLFPPFLTGTAAARHMLDGGVILTISTTAAVNSAPGSGGLAPASAAVETLTRQMAIEFGDRDIRSICLRPNGIPEAARTDSHSNAVFTAAARRHGMRLEQMLETFPGGTALRRSPTLREVGDAAAFFASDAASSFTGTVEKIGPGDTTMLV